jgi:signal transduction histidine kinase
MPRLRLRTILLLINLVVLALPLGGIFWARIYESALIRQTESELVAQAAFIAAAYREAFERLLAQRDAKGRPALALPADYGLPITVQPLPGAGPWQPRPAQLDLAIDPIHPKAPEPLAPATTPDAIAEAIGHGLNAILRDVQLVTLAGIRVVNTRGSIVASTGGDLGLSLAAYEEVQRALSGEFVSLMRDRASERPPPPLGSISRGTRIRVHVAVPIIRNGRVLGATLLVRTPANIKQAIYGKRYPLLYGALGLLAVVLTLSLLSSRTISRPVQRLMAQARRAARGEQGAVTPLAHPGTREIAELSATVAAMAQTLEQRASYIRDFAAHVSHEFKTPLTAIQGSVELLRDHAESMSPDERSRFLGILWSDAQRLENLVRRLLELARADVMRVGEESTELAPVLNAIAARYRELGLQVDIIGLQMPVRVAMASETLESVIGNLLDNTRQHAGTAARVTLSWSVDLYEAPPMVSIEVADNGAGISGANAARIFEPFFTTARKQGNTGLGLAILRSLVTAHRGDIRLLPTGAGTLFQIRLPMKPYEQRS